MILENELRMGNLLQVEMHPNEMKVITVTGVKKDNIYFGDTYYVLPSRIAKPIPLTEEWVRRFCSESFFTSDPQEYKASKAYRINDVLIHQPDEEVEEFKMWITDYCWRDLTRTIEIKYVHSLQNIIYALTGQELTITQQ